MVKVTSIDTSGLSRLMLGISSALIGTGQSGDLNQVVRDETRRLAMEIGRPPTAKQILRSEKRVKRDIGSVFLKSPAHPLPFKKSEGSELTWLEAGPNFLLGANKNAVFSEGNLSSGEIKDLYYRAKGKLPVEKYATLGKRGQQHVKRANRLIAPLSKITELFNYLKSKIGKRNASFAETAAALGAKLNTRTRKHFPTRKNITQLGGLSNPSNPSVTFGSRAKGVSLMGEQVQKSVNARRRIMAARLKLILTNYAVDHKEGRKIRHHH